MIFECLYHTKGKNNFCRRQYAANNYSNALYHIFSLHAKGLLSVPISEELKIEYVKQIKESELI